MNGPERYETAVDLRMVIAHAELALKRLEGVEGSTPASGSPDRVAGRQPDAPLTSDSARPFAGQAERVLGTLADMWESQAASKQQQTALYHETRCAETREILEAEAAVLESCASKLREALSVAQSDRNEGERCQQVCGDTRCSEPAGHSGCCVFEHPAAPGAGVERSGPANGSCDGGAEPSEGAKA